MLQNVISEATTVHYSLGTAHNTNRKLNSNHFISPDSLQVVSMYPADILPQFASRIHGFQKA